ncbi:DUF6092 family protein [Actinomadura oligospora]|uniref:DUF6092 family protein n=1 Tax=Actinomadura oligospora TaxID=111804 RepID=UPI0004B770D4|nr:DUF6092 family protein [Actinomadura oligospora]
MTTTPESTRREAGLSRRESELAQLAAYLLASSRSLLDDPAVYGSFRLIDAARRTLLILESEGVANADFTAVRTQIEEVVRAKTEVDVQAFLDTLCLQMAHALKAADPDTLDTNL